MCAGKEWYEPPLHKELCKGHKWYEQQLNEHNLAKDCVQLRSGMNHSSMHRLREKERDENSDGVWCLPNIYHDDTVRKPIVSPT